MSTLVRTSSALAAVRHPERIIAVRAVPFGGPVRVDDGAGPYLEQWQATTFETLREQPPVLLDHDVRRPVGKVVRLERGVFQLTGGLSLDVNNVTIRGAGMDKTVLSFAGQRGGAGPRRHAGDV